MAYCLLSMRFSIKEFSFLVIISKSFLIEPFRDRCHTIVATSPDDFRDYCDASRYDYDILSFVPDLFSIIST